MPKLAYKNIRDDVIKHSHGRHQKDMAVLHETISPDYKGWKDINGIVAYLTKIDYGIHGLTDAEGHIAWALGCGNCVFYHAGGVNERSVGIEQVSRVPSVSPCNRVRRALWAARNPQLRATAKLLAAWHNADRKHHPLRYSDGTKPGVTSHWDVSRHFSSSDGHTDCWPVHKGGYYPIIQVIFMARIYAKARWRF